MPNRKCRSRLLLTVAVLAATPALPGPALWAQGGTPLYTSAGVTPAAVKQGHFGSCYFHASIAAIAVHHADALRSAIHEQGGGQYTVTFVDGRSETVYQEDVLFARRNRFDLSDGLWVSVLLRAMAQRTLRADLIDSLGASGLPPSARSGAENLLRSNDTLLLAYDRAIRATVSQDGSLSLEGLRSALSAQADALHIPVFLSAPVVSFLDSQGFFNALANHVQRDGELFGAYRAVGQGGIPAQVLALFLGPASDFQTGSAEHARSILARSQQSGSPAVAMTGDSLDPGVRERVRAQGGPADWFVDGHAYSVLAFDPYSGSVTLRNPWAQQPGPDGVFSLQLADFAAAFPNIDTGR